MARPLPPALTTAVDATLRAYRTQGDRFSKLSAGVSDRVYLSGLRSEVNTYAARLLRQYGWPEHPGIQASLALLISDPTWQWCAGQAALRAAATADTRQQAARLIDQGLLGLQAPYQRYGTVYTVAVRTVRVTQIESESIVNARRAAIGLPPLAESIGRLQATLPPRPQPSGLTRPVLLRPVCQEFTSAAALNAPLSAASITLLEHEAHRLMEQDQAARLGRPDARKGMGEADAESIAWLQRVLNESGWPSTNRTGSPELANNVWLLTQHADRKPSLQACVLDLLGQQRSTLPEARHFAYLTDRVLTGAGQLQVYGTQANYDEVNKRLEPKPLVDPARVNERRARMGLESLEAYLEGFKEFIRQAAPPRP
ncbi:DUF6624 domain-containing protein [Deinococcus sp. QL22]|uniref:DUF6624 domain-containing protein n=1 Tax=Deinococcus sp. QL22 TaxID=2939437 RepID=UPI002017CF91|nr:DUF6624 domain-containing protein [Deinococcus sp. QL22]UQN06466.1 hypothetical protein M1R55_00685 [Deinococcus sp. QL22]